MNDLQIDQALADKMVEIAIGECAESQFAGDKKRARQAIQLGSCEACIYMSNSLVRQISNYIGQIDKTVKAVYQYEPVKGQEITNVDLHEPVEKHNGINLIAWVDRKSAALNTLVGTLETALSKSQRDIGCVKATKACYTLDLQMVDDKDVREKRGLGLLVESPYIQSRLVWQRSSISSEQKVHEEISKPILAEYPLPDTFDPELMPVSRLVYHASTIESIPPEERVSLEPHLTELKVIIIRRLISDQLAYINIAKKWFTISDLADILHRRIGPGKIGGKAAGMLLAARILNEVADDEVRNSLSIPDSHFLGSDLLYIFMAMNGLTYWNDQKYKPEKLIWAEYPQIQKEFLAGKLPPEMVLELKELLAESGTAPLIVRSSSQLEDNFGTSFAGKYDSFFCPNQGTPEENLVNLTNAIKQTYASTLKPEALLYRRSKGLQDYDERMAVLIQTVQGEKFGHFYFPHAAGVAFSHNLFRWSPEIRREEGFARLVWGLGTRAVQRVGDDYPRLVALSHPTLQPDDSTEAIRRYSQQYVDLIDLEDNQLKTLPIHKVLTASYPILRYMVQIEQDGYFSTPRTRVSNNDISRLAITFEELLQRTPVAELLSRILRTIEANYHASVDMEFTIHIPNPRELDPQVQISILQCRPQSHLQDIYKGQLPEDLTSDDVIFSTQFMVPQGYLPEIRYIIFVKPAEYYALPTLDDRREVGRVVSNLNTKLEEKNFICIGPGRWGTLNPDLGVFVSYADIHNAGALIELSGKGIGPAPEPSLGTHFFQDLMEAIIYPLVIRLDDEGVVFKREFFYQTPNCLSEWVDADENVAKCLHLIDVSSYKPNFHIELLMDDEKSQAVAYLAPDK